MPAKENSYDLQKLRGLQSEFEEQASLQIISISIAKLTFSPSK